MDGQSKYAWARRQRPKPVGEGRKLTRDEAVSRGAQVAA